MAFLPTQNIVRTGLNPTFASCDPADDTFTPGDTVRIEVINASGVSVSVLFEQRPDEWTRRAAGPAPTVLVVAVPAGERRRIGPLPAHRFTGRIGYFTTPTSCTIAVFDLPA